MPTKRTKVVRMRQGSDLREWLEMLFGDELFYRYFGCRGDEPYAKLCALIYYDPSHNRDTESLRELWVMHRDEILRVRDELAPGVELWAERFDGEGSEAGE